MHKETRIQFTIYCSNYFKWISVLLYGIEPNMSAFSFLNVLVCNLSYHAAHVGRVPMSICRVMYGFGGGAYGMPSWSAVRHRSIWKDRHFTCMAWMNRTVMSRWTRQCQDNKCLHKQFDDICSSMDCHLGEHDLIRVPSMVCLMMNLKAEKPWCRDIRRFWILFTSWWSHPCLVASWRAHFASVRSTSSY